jgi:hypothetical protein
MRIVSTISHHTRWRSRLGAILEAGAAIRTLVARLVTGGDHPPAHPPHPPPDLFGEPSAEHGE